MSKAKFTYDESGATFLYFVLSFLTLILVPATYYLWPNEFQEDESKSPCRCLGCQNKKRHMRDQSKWKKSKRGLVRFIIGIGWLIYAFIAYKCATMQHEYVNWDPYEILGVREDATLAEIKRAYRNLSLIHHPDKGSGNEEMFVKISKAHRALTDAEARENWRKYGNPDGPSATSFGIALPSWIVEKENSFVVLGIYALMFMVALPVSVGVWWYRSVKFGSDKVLINTSELYYYFIHRTPNMALKRVIMILSASLEFSKSHNREVIERPTDNIEVPKLMRELPNLGETNKERPLCFSYSIKARALLHAHLSRVKLPQSTLEQDRCFIVSKCPHLQQEFVHCISQLITLALSGRVQNMPNLVTLENAMKLGPLIVQAMWEYQSPLLQLPHFSEDVLKNLERRKIKIKSIDELAKMKESERRETLKIFTDDQYEDIKRTISRMPVIKVENKFEVLDDEDPGIITTGSIVTAIVKLKRKGRLSYSEEPELDQNKSSSGDEEEDWNTKFQEKVVKKQKVFESKPKKSHTVHCPYFPDDKQEFWWVYIVDRKRFQLVTAPLLVTSLVDSEEIELKFTAPKAGVYSYTIVVRSDSYVDCITQKQTRIEVKPARENNLEAAYDISSDEIEDEQSSAHDSDLLTDTE